MSFSFIKGSRRAIPLVLLVAALASCSKEDTLTNTNNPDLAAKPKPPTTSGLTPLEQLGKKIYFDNSFSDDGNGVVIQSCSSCHLPDQGFAAFGDLGPTGTYLRSFEGGFAEGAVAGLFGGRKAPSASYATFSPVLTRKKGNGGELEFFGGLFWDGRATGLRLNSTAAEQALGPFESGVEHNFTRLKLLQYIKNNIDGSYVGWKNVYGSNLDLSRPTAIDSNYDKVGRAIAAYEASKEVNQFSSRYDGYLKGTETLNQQELQGLSLVTDLKKAACVSCHAIKTAPAMFTDFGYDNIGLPRNPSIRTPEGADYGLYNFLNSLPASNPWKAFAIDNSGKFKTPTLRNVAKGEGNRRYMHNGVFTSLEQVVHFYNTRDVPGAGWDNQPWGPPEVASTMKTGGEVGNLGLTHDEELAIVAFLRTLSDRNTVLPPANNN